MQSGSAQQRRQSACGSGGRAESGRGGCCFASRSWARRGLERRSPPSRRRGRRPPRARSCRARREGQGGGEAGRHDCMDVAAGTHGRQMHGTRASTLQVTRSPAQVHLAPLGALGLLLQQARKKEGSMHGVAAAGQPDAACRARQRPKAAHAARTKRPAAPPACSPPRAARTTSPTGGSPSGR